MCIRDSNSTTNVPLPLQLRRPPEQQLLLLLLLLFLVELLVGQYKAKAKRLDGSIELVAWLPPSSICFFVQVLAKPLAGQPETDEEREMWPWWKAKKVVLYCTVTYC